MGGDDGLAGGGRGCQREKRSGGGSRQSATQWVWVRVKENNSRERGCWASWVELGWVGPDWLAAYFFPLSLFFFCLIF